MSRHPVLTVVGSQAKARLEAGAPPFAQLSCGFALTAGLWRFVMFTPTGLGQNTFLLHFAAKLFEGHLK